MVELEETSLGGKFTVNTDSDFDVSQKYCVISVKEIYCLIIDFTLYYFEIQVYFLVHIPIGNKSIELEQIKFWKEITPTLMKIVACLGTECLV